MVQIHVDRAQLAAGGALDPRVARACLGTHRLQHFGEAHIALDTVAPDALDAHRAAAERAGREEVRGGRGIAFYEGRSRGAVARAGYLEGAPFLPRDLDAEAAHHVERDLDVGLGDE